MIKAGSVVLFQGDSITDAGRSKIRNKDLGDGFPFVLSEFFKNEHPEMNVTVINRGISGNRSRDLVGRWTKDCVALKPDYLTILIGVNDTWRRYDDNDPTSDEDFEKNLRTILERSRAETNAEILLLVPYLIDLNEKVSRMREDLSGKQAVVKRLAKEFGTRLLDLDEVFKAAVANGTKPEFISADGVHPTEEGGHRMIAAEWLKVW